MRRHDRGTRAAVWTQVAFVGGLGGAFLIGWRLPALELLAFFIAFLLVVGVAGVLQAVVERRWVFWAVLPATALTGLATLMLAGDLALAESGHPTEVVVVEHDVAVSHGAKGTTYTHTYVLEHPDGRPLEQEMTYRGEGGFDGVGEGTTLTVLVDPSGEASVRPADDVDISAATGILVVGLVATTGAFAACLVSTASARRRDVAVARPGPHGRHRPPR